MTVFLSPSQIIDYAKNHEEEVIALRRELHQIPELSWQEEKTIRFIKNIIHSSMQNAPFPIEFVEKEGGIWVDITPFPDRERILFRADIDALPIDEQTDLHFQSTHPGIMHACGHDCHTAMLLSAFRLFCSGKIAPERNIRFVWQRAEEVTHIKSGGARLIEEGVCEGIDELFGLHISSTCKLGLFTSIQGPMMCSADHISISVKTSGGHVMRPQEGSNAIDLMTDLHVALRGFDLRTVGPNEVISFIPALSNSGNTSNIRPSSGKMIYSFRNFLSPERKKDFLSALKSKIQSIVHSYPLASLSHFEYTKGHPTLINSEESFGNVQNLLERHGFETALTQPLLSGEDFAYYLQKCKGSFWCLGAKEDVIWDHHTPYFNPSEKALWQGVAFWLLLGSSLSNERDSLS